MHVVFIKIYLSRYIVDKVMKSKLKPLPWLLTILIKNELILISNFIKKLLSNLTSYTKKATEKKYRQRFIDTIHYIFNNKFIRFAIKSRPQYVDLAYRKNFPYIVIVNISYLPQKISSAHTQH